MLISRTSIVVLASMLLVAPASAQDAKSTQAPAKEKKICKRIVGTGTILPRSFCLTKSEWAEFNAHNQGKTDEELARRINISPRPLEHP